MLLGKLFLAAAVAAQAAFGSLIKSRSPFAIKEKHTLPSRWKLVGKPDADHTVELRIGVKQGNFPELEKRLYEGISQNHEK